MPVVRIAALVVAYATLLLLGLSWLVGARSVVQALAAGLLLAIGAPWLTVQGLVTLVRGERTVLHRTVALLSLAFPAVVVVLFVGARVRG